MHDARHQATAKRGRMTPADRTSQLIAETRRLLPDLEQASARLEQDPGDFLSRVFPEEDLGTRAIVGAGGALESMNLHDLEDALRRHREEVLEAGKRALEKVRAEGENAKLDPPEALGLEVIVNLTARPAILIRNGHFLDPPPPWESLEADRASIEAAAQSVGRIQLAGNPQMHWVGTGFLAGEDVVITNRHVAEVFSVVDPSERWTFRPGMTANINYFEDPDAGEYPEFALTEIIGVHERFDLALFRAAVDTGGSGAPKPLTLASEPPEPLDDRTIYVLGYPAFSPYNGREAMRLIFADIYNVKRLQPGMVLTALEDAGLFNHDCSTLGGNSGSCVIDLETNDVIGLHFQGTYLKYNQAVALWELRDDQLLVEAGVAFN
jgi:hypothetical protein